MQGLGLVVVLVTLVICACTNYREIADEFLGLTTLLVLAAAFVLTIGLRLRQGSRWSRAVVLWLFPLPIVDGFIEGTRMPPLLVFLTAQYLVYLYVLTKPEVLPCFRAQR